MANIPDIRFKGFTGDWEKRKLGDIADVTKLAGFEFTEHVVYSDEGNIIALRGLNIKNGQLVLDDVKYIDGSNFSKLNRSKLYIDDIMFTYVGTVGEVAIIKENDKFYLAPNVARIRVKSDDSPKFISHYMRTESFYRHVIFPLVASSSQPALSMENIRKFEIYLPKSRDEQDKLSEFFDGLDNLIILWQRKCDETKQLKKYMLKKMFPKKGEKIPEIRFEGFTDDWEERKLSDVTESIKNGYTYKPDGSRDHRYKITRIESISSGVINTEKLGSSDEVNENYRLMDGDILFSHINSLSYIANTALYTANLGEIYHGMNLLNIRSRQGEIDSHFLLHLLKKESTRDWFRIIAKPAVNQASISTAEVGSFGFLMPRMEEQKKISLVLDSLDSLITHNQRKCDELKEFKKYMLKNMFPQKE